MTRRGRVVLVVLALVVVTAIVLGWGGAAAGGGHDSVITHTLTVERGDTLWAIAAGITPAGDDVREYVRWIADVNGLDSPELWAGQVLKVPVVAQSE